MSDTPLPENNHNAQAESGAATPERKHHKNGGTPAKQPVVDESIFRELWDFMRVRKKFWLAPILIALVLLGMLFFFAQTAGVVSPFLYAF